MTIRPIVFLSDYGLSDPFVGICHGVIARITPEAKVIDLTHAIPRQDVLRGAIELGRAIPYLPPDAVFVAVVDPGVGSARRSIAVAAAGAFLVGPDNGVLSVAWRALGGADSAVETSASRRSAGSRSPSRWSRRAPSAHGSPGWTASATFSSTRPCRTCRPDRSRSSNGSSS
jgi:S-adenosylmethionine hydrolase